MYSIKINNFEINLKKELVLLYLIFKLNVYVPRFCYSSYLNIAGNCRMCLLEIEKGDKLIIGCAFPLYPGISIKTNSIKVQKARESIIEFLLLNHPLDCPICDQASQCDLQDQSLIYGSSFSRFFNKNKYTTNNKLFGFFLKGILTRCIQCTKCIRLNITIINKLIQKSINILSTRQIMLGNINRGGISSISVFFDNLKFWMLVIYSVINYIYNSYNLFNKLKLDYFNSINIFNFFVSYFVNICPVGSLLNNYVGGISRSWDLNFFVKSNNKSINYFELKFKRFIFNLI